MKRHSLLLTLGLALATTYALAQTGGQAGQYPSSQSPTTQQAPSTQPAPPSTSPDQGQATTPDQSAQSAATVPDNDTLEQEVQQKLATEPALKSVQVKAKKGVVTLSGTVASKAERKHAEELAKSVPGVKKVHAKLKVNPNAAPTTSGAAETPAPSNAGSEAGNMSAQAGVQQGTREPGNMTGATTPQGTENSSAQAGAATQPSPGTEQNEPGQTQPGMTQEGVQTPNPNNQMGTTQSATQIQSEIQNALAQQGTLNGSNIQVNVTDTDVELTGTVATPDQKQAAERIAGSYAGSRRVVNHITVSSLSGQTGQNPGAPAASQPQTMPGQGNVNPQMPPRQSPPPQQNPQNPPMSETPPPQPQPQL